MRKLACFALVVAILSGTAWAGGGYFFLPSRNFFFNNPGRFPVHSGFDGGFSRFGRHSRFGGYSRYDRSCDVPGGFIQTPRVFAPDRGIYNLVVHSPSRTEIIRANSSDIIFNVEPPRALVYIDGKLIGSAGDFANERNRYMVLEGEHTLRIEYPGYERFQTKMNVAPNRTLNLDIELKIK